MSYLVLARKWRPQGFDDLTGQEPITRILKNAISQNRTAHAYIFSGPRGVGKTSTARILAKAMNCVDGPTPLPCGTCAFCTAITEGSSVDVIEIDGASNNSVDDIRDLRERVKYAPSGGRFKVYIIDEVHMLSGSAFNALLKTLEEPPAHVIFVLATTEMKKIPATVLSRCQHMPFRRISSAQIRGRLQQIADTEGMKVSPSALGLIARAADGSMRDSLTILDQISSLSDEITDEDVTGLLGMTDIRVMADLARALLTGQRIEIVKAISVLSEQGADMRAFAKDLVQFFRDLLVASVLDDPSEILDMGADEVSVVRELVALASEDLLTLMLSEIIRAETDVRNASAPRLALEMALIRASFLSAMKPVKEIIERLDTYGSGGQRPPVQKKAVDTAVPPAERPPATLQQRPAEDEPVAKAMESVSSTAQEVVPEQATEQPSTAEGDITAAWQKTLEKIGAPLSSKLSPADTDFNGKELLLTLNGGAGLFLDSIQKSMPDIEACLAREYGSPVRIKLTALQKKPVRKRDLKEKVLSDPVIKEALELFEGKIVDVTERENQKKIKNGG